MAEPTKGELYEVVGTLLAKFYPNNQSDKLIEETITYAQQVWKMVDEKHGGGGED